MPDRINHLFRAMSDPTRREIFHVLVVAATALSIHQISEQFHITRQGITKHLNLLREAGLVEFRTNGRERLCTANVEPLREFRDWLAWYERFWDQKLRDLGRYLDDKRS